MHGLHTGTSLPTCGPAKRYPKRDVAFVPYEVPRGLALQTPDQQRLP